MSFSFNIRIFLFFFLFFTATLSAFTVGQCVSWTSSSLPMLQGNETHIIVSDEEGSWIGSTLMLGAFFGAIPAGYIVGFLGPKITLIVLGVPIILSWIIIAYR